MFCFDIESNVLAFPYWLPYCCLAGHLLHMKIAKYPLLCISHAQFFVKVTTVPNYKRLMESNVPIHLSGYTKWVALFSYRTLGFCDLNGDSLAKMKEVSSGCRCFYVPAIVQFFLLSGNPIWSVLWRSEMLSRSDPNFQRWLGSIGEHLI